MSHDSPKQSSLAQIIWRARTLPLELAVKGYQKGVAPLLPRGQCRFYPSCSHYALDALKEHGMIKGSCATTWRLLRCNPFGGKGFDPACDFAMPWEVEKRRKVREQRAKDDSHQPDHANAQKSPRDI